MTQQILTTPNVVSCSYSPAQAPALSRTGPYKWIVHPAVDMLLCCGGVVWILFAAHFFCAAPANNLIILQVLAVCAVMGTHLLGETHIAATLARIYGSENARRKFQTYTVGMALLFAALGLAGLLVPQLTPLMAKAYLIFVVQHFTAQTYGIVLLYCYKSSYNLSQNDKLLLRGLLNTTAILAIVRQFTYKAYSGTGFLAQPVPFWGPLPQWVAQCTSAVLALFVLAIVCVVAKNFWRDRRLMPLPAVLTLLTGVAIFAMNRDQSSVLFLYAPAFYHGSQYVVLSLAYYLKERGLPAEIPATQIYKAFVQPAALRYMGIMLLASSTIYFALPRLLEEFGVKYTLAFATIFLAFNLHHFVTDMAIWKMRDPATRQLLVN